MGVVLKKPENVDRLVISYLKYKTVVHEIYYYLLVCLARMCGIEHTSPICQGYVVNYEFFSITLQASLLSYSEIRSITVAKKYLFLIEQIDVWSFYYRD